MNWKLLSPFGTTRPRVTARNFVLLLATMVALGGIYVLSVVWRASVAEHKWFGKSELIPLAMTQRKFTEPASADSFTFGTFTFIREGKPVAVHKQLINGFQHTYGSALAAFELGETPADLLFRANEYAEAIFCKDRVKPKHLMDTKKDLWNNAVGRRIGCEARERRLQGAEADDFIARRVLRAIENGEVLKHYLDARVQSLPIPERSGCPGLQKLCKLGSSQS